MAVYEGMHVYYSVLHNCDLCSMNCTTSKQMKFAYKKFSSARTKCKSIVTKVYAPYALDELKKSSQMCELGYSALQYF
jgi:hypothetical protein